LKKLTLNINKNSFRPQNLFRNEINQKTIIKYQLITVREQIKIWEFYSILNLRKLEFEKLFGSIKLRFEF